MNLRTFVILFIIFISLGAYVWFFEVEKPEQANPVHVKKLLDFNAADVREIVLTRENQRIVFQKQGNQWMITEPVKKKARNNMVSGLLSLFDLGFIKEISTDMSEAPKYGLDHPVIQFELIFSTGVPSKTLLIGDNSPGATSCYAKLKNDPRIVLLGSLYRNDLNRDLSFFID